MHTNYKKSDCKNCSSNGSNIKRRFVKQQLKQNEELSLSPEAGHLLFILEGEIEVLEMNNIHLCRTNEMVLIGYNNKNCITAKTESTLLILCFTTNYNVCANINLERIQHTIQSISYKFNTLEINPPMLDFVKSVIFYLDQEIYCDYLHEAKAVEIFIIYRFFYAPEELATFFYPVLYKELAFASTVRTNYEKAKTVQELAELCGYSLSKFKILFVKHFGISPYQWMQQQKLSKIKASLLDKTIPIKYIAHEFGFVDQSHLNAFCKKHLNVTPLQIRNNSED